jgi:hypothetical protein
MALTPSTSFTQDVDDVYLGVVVDTTPDYGDGGNPARNAAANYLLWSKTDSGGNRVFNNPDHGNVLTIITWDVQTPTPGWYERMLMRIQFYNPATAYVPEVSVNGVISQYASIVYYATTDKVYKCKLASTGNLPTDATYWEEVTDLSTLISNTNVSTTISDTYVRAIVDEGMRELFARMGAECGCDLQQNYKAYKLNGLLISANSAVASGNYDEMDKIITYIASQLVQLN